MIYKKIIQIISIFTCLVCMVDSALADTPELDIKTIIQKIDNSTHYIKAIDQIDHKPQSSFKSVLSSSLLKLMKEKYQDNEWNIVLRLSDQYINSSNIYDQKVLLDVYFMRAYGEQKLGNPRAAIRNYLKYLSIFITRPESSTKHLSRVFRNMVLIGNELSKGNVDDLKRLISSIAALKLSTDDRTELIFLNAMILANQKIEIDDYSKNIALNWLNDVYKMQSQAYKRAKALYYSSIIYIKQGDLKNAEKKVNKILAEKKLEKGQITDLATISLARIYGAQKKLKKSFETYSSIGAESSFHKDALYEQIFILKRMKKYFEASKVSEQLIARYPDDPKTHDIKNTISQLYMVSGQTQKALTAIDNQKKYWLDLQDWVRKKYTAKAIDAEKVYQLNTKLNETGLLSIPVSLGRYASMFQKVDHLRRHASGSRDEVRSMILNLGRIGFHSYMPEIIGRSTQLRQAVKNLFEIGDQLVAAELEVYKKKIPKSLKAALEVSHKRRTDLFVTENRFKVDRGSPDQFAKTLDLNNRLVKLNERLVDMTANLRFYTYKNQVLGQNFGLESDLITDLQNRSRAIKNAILRGAEIVRSRSILNLRYSNPIRGVKRLLLEGMTQLHADYIQLYRVRDRYKHINEKYLAYEIEDVWKKFDHLAVVLFDVLHKVENDFNENILSNVNDFDQLDALYAKVIAELDGVERTLLNQLNENFETDFAEIDRQITNQIAYQSKLSGDSNWYNFIDEERKLKGIDTEYINEKGSVIRSSGYIGKEAQ